MTTTQQQAKSDEIAELRDEVSRIAQFLAANGLQSTASDAEELDFEDVGEEIPGVRPARRRRRELADDADPVVQRSFRLRKSLAMQFKAKAAANGLTLQEAINALMLVYLEDSSIIERA